MGGFRKILWIFLLGVTLGGLMAISLKYPLKAATYTEAATLCVDHMGVSRVKVGLSGKIYTVVCNKDSKTFNLK